MAKFFSSLFGRAEKEEPFQPAPVAEPAYDPEYVAYCIEMEQVISAHEANLHKSDDPKEIAMETLKVVCSFYGGDWAGILDIDLDLDVWNPLWWYNKGRLDETVQLFGEFELAKYMPTWIQALQEGTPIQVFDINDIRNIYPQEYEVYKRLKVNSVIGVPFGPNPVGFLAIRNPTRYVTHPSAMSVLAYVIHRAMAQQKTIESSKLALSADEIQSDRDIIINFFGSMEIQTSKGVLKERDFNSPKSSRVATYLMLNSKSAHSAWEIAEAIWPDDPDKIEVISEYIRGYIRTFRKAFELISDYQLIETAASGYQINHDFHIMTDLQQFDLLWEQAQHAVSISHRVDLLKQAVEMYKGHVFENACDEHWIIGTVTHYKSRYIGIVNELLATLMDAGDYTSVQQYATRAIQLTPENVKAYYWLVRAMVKLDCFEMAKNEINHARRNLTHEEFASLKKLVTIDSELPFTLLFDGE